jgi:histidinol-phosphate phosphatase family protein
MSRVHFQSGGVYHSHPRKAILLDRDKTLNADPGYLNDPEKVELLTGVVPGLQKLQAAGYQFIILTNQSGVGRGLISPEALFAVNQRLLELLLRDYIRIERIYYCPHIDADQCNCRKPEPGLVDAAISDFALDPALTWLMGDRFRDLACGSHLSLPGILVGSEEGSPDSWTDRCPSNLRFHVSSLEEAADRILM